MSKNLELKIEDKLELLTMFEGPETYTEACEVTTECAIENSKEFKEVLMEDHSEADAESILRNSVVQAVGVFS